MGYLRRAALAATLITTAGLALAPAMAQDSGVWSAPALSQDPPRKTGIEPFDGKPVTYEALPASEVTKKWNLCLLIPHTTNDVQRAYMYGYIEEAKRLGVKLTIYDAGGYGNVDKQLAQFDDCLTTKADAVIVFAVSTTGLNQKIKDARAAGVKVVDNNVGVDTESDARVVVAYTGVGRRLGEQLTAKYPKGSGKASVVVIPGPAGIPWSEDTAKGFKDNIGNSDVVIEKVAYSQTSRLDQMPLVEDVLQTYPDLKAIVGLGTTAEAATNILREQGRTGEIGLYASYMTPDLVEPIRRGDVEVVAVENSVVIAKMTIDETVRLLENKLVYKDVLPDVTLVTKENLDAAIPLNFAPRDWKIQFSTE